MASARAAALAQGRAAQLADMQPLRDGRREALLARALAELRSLQVARDLAEAAAVPAGLQAAATVAREAAGSATREAGEGALAAARALALARSHPADWCHVGWLEEQRGEDEAARMAYAQALQLAPAHLGAHLHATLLGARSGPLEQAAAQAAAARAQLGDVPVAGLLVGIVQGLAGQHDAARATLRALLAAVAEPAPRQVVLALWLLRLEQPVPARAMLQVALGQDARSVSALLAQALVLEADGDMAQAERSVARALQLAPGDGMALACRAFLLEARGRLDAARQGYERAVEVMPACGISWLGLARVCERSAAWKDAEQAYAQARERLAGRAEPHLGLAFARHGLKRPAEALQDVAAALERDPGQPLACLLGAVLSGDRLGNWAAALEHLLRCQALGGAYPGLPAWIASAQAKAGR